MNELEVNTRTPSPLLPVAAIRGRPQHVARITHMIWCALDSLIPIPRLNSVNTVHLPKGNKTTTILQTAFVCLRYLRNIFIKQSTFPNYLNLPSFHVSCKVVLNS